MSTKKGRYGNPAKRGTSGPPGWLADAVDPWMCYGRLVDPEGRYRIRRSELLVTDTDRLAAMLADSMRQALLDGEGAG